MSLAFLNPLYLLYPLYQISDLEVGMKIVTFVQRETLNYHKVG